MKKLILLISVVFLSAGSSLMAKTEPCMVPMAVEISGPFYEDKSIEGVPFEIKLKNYTCVTTLCIGRQTCEMIGADWSNAQICEGIEGEPEVACYDIDPEEGSAQKFTYEYKGKEYSFLLKLNEQGNWMSWEVELVE